MTPETAGRTLSPDLCVACKHDMAHHDQPDCWECSNAGTICDLLEDLRVVAGVPFRCPWCDSPATYCTAHTHGTVNGPAMHCQRSPAHNEFSPEGFARWDVKP